MAVAGYRSQIRRGGIPTTTVSEPFTALGSNVFQVALAARRVVDPTAIWHLSDSSGTISFASIGAFDFLFGEATVPGVSGTLRFTGTFIPITTAAEIVSEVKAHSMEESSDLLDTTVYTGVGGSRVRKRIYGLADAKASFDMNVNVTDMPRLSTLSSQGSTVLVEIINGVSTPVFRGFGKIASIKRSGAVEGLIEASVEWQLAAQRDDRTGFISGYSERNPTLP